MVQITDSLVITRDPFKEQMQNDYTGGSYVKNFLNWRVIADDEEVDMDLILEASTSTENSDAYVLWVIRDADGMAVLDDAGKPKVRRTLHEEVRIKGVPPACTGCSENTRKARQSQPYWSL